MTISPFILEAPLKLFGQVLLTLTLIMGLSIPAQATVIRCGVAIGYPPYQYADAQGKAAGLDVDIAKEVFKTAHLEVQFILGEWEELLPNLYHKKGTIDVIVGAEINQHRAKLVAFTSAIYLRHNALFVLEKSPIQKVSDLYGKLVAGDRDSFFENRLGDEKDLIRIVRTPSKEDSFQRLKSGKVLAVISPEEVGTYFSKKLDLNLRTVGEKDPGTPVAFAVKKGNKPLLDSLETAIQVLKKNHKIKVLLQEGSLSNNKNHKN